MTDITSSVQIILQEAGYATWLVPVEQITAVCFEDAAVMGFVCVFDEPESLLRSWRSVESVLLARHAPRFREAEDKAWNVYFHLSLPEIRQRRGVPREFGALTKTWSGRERLRHAASSDTKPS